MESFPNKIFKYTKKSKRGLVEFFVRQQNKQKKIRLLILLFEILAFGIVAYLIVLPFYPILKYKFFYNAPQIFLDVQNEENSKETAIKIKNHLPQAEYDVSPNRIIIAKIGVNAPIVESQNAEYGLWRGAWRLPKSSTPDKGGNTIITGHRFKYLPPNNLTFYLLDKLREGDLVSIIWEGKDYLYKTRKTKIVDATDLSILKPSQEPILTMFTCHPIYSTKQRLVIIADLVE